jgi:hypothetical protein
MSAKITKVDNVDASKPGKKNMWNRNRNTNKSEPQELNSNKSEPQEFNSNKIKENVSIDNGKCPVSNDKNHFQIPKRKFRANASTRSGRSGAAQTSATRPEESASGNEMSYTTPSVPLPHMIPLTSADHEKSAEFHLHMAELYGLQRDSFLDEELQKIYIVYTALLENDKHTKTPDDQTLVDDFNML